MTGGNVVLMHGLGNSGAIFAPLLRELRPGTECHAPELPWSSGRLFGWRNESDAASAVAEVLDAVPGGADVVVAHSYATIPLLELLSRRALAGEPADIPALILLCPFYRPRAEDFGWDLMADLLQMFPRTMRDGIRLQSGRPVSEDLLDLMAKRLCEWVGPYGWLRFLDGYLRTPTLRTDLVTVPCVVVGGEDDRTAPATEARGLAAALPAGRAHIVTGGHFPMVEHPALLAELVHTALDRRSTPVTATTGT